MNPEFVLIGDPVAHSLSPVMHNALYQELGKVKWPFSRWHYSAVRCANEEEAAYQIDLVRTGRYRGMNVTMPYKKLAFSCADYADAGVIAAGGANVLVRDEDLKLCAYNTDGLGAVRAIERMTDMPLTGARVLVCGTGPTSLAIAAASAQAGALEVTLLSRDEAKALSCVNRIRTSVEPHEASVLHGRNYAQAEALVSKVDVIVDATPRGMTRQSLIRVCCIADRSCSIPSTVMARPRCSQVPGDMARPAWTDWRCSSSRRHSRSRSGLMPWRFPSRSTATSCAMPRCMPIRDAVLW